MNTQNSDTAEQPKADALSSAAMARRHMLLKGLGKGSAVLAAALPISTLAAPTIVTSNNKLCTVSGVQSQVNSQVTEKVTCEGFTPNFYATLSNWPGYNAGPPAKASNTVGATTFDDNAKFSTVFGSGSTSSNIYNTVKNSPTSDEAVWITALLNAFRNVSVLNTNFPYTPVEVVAFYQSPTQSAAALAFFRGYMQTRTA